MELFPCDSFPHSERAPPLQSLIAIAHRAKGTMLHSLLPACFYYLASYNTHVLTGDLTVILGHSVASAITIGRESLLSDSMDIWRSVLEATKPHAHCHRALASYFESTVGFERLSNAAIFSFDLRFLRHLGVCLTCRSAISRKFWDALGSLWKRLPLLFDLGSWVSMKESTFWGSDGGLLNVCGDCS